jgi:hypothetical protein
MMAWLVYLCVGGMKCDEISVCLAVIYVYVMKCDERSVCRH